MSNVVQKPSTISVDTDDLKKKSSYKIGDPLNPKTPFNQATDLIDYVSNMYGLDSDAKMQLDALMRSGASDESIGKFISDTLGARRDEEYNSESARVMRERSAGLNPDIAGLSGESGAVSNTFEPLPSSGGRGTLSSRFEGTLSSLIKLATFGISAYSGISNAFIKQGMVLAGAVESDIAGVLGDDKGIVTDVDKFISDHINSRRLNSSKARKYVSLVGSRINASDVILNRLKTKSDINNAYADSQISLHKSSDDFIKQSISIVDNCQDAALVASRSDLLEKQMKEKFLLDHPDYTEETLDAELRKLQSDADYSTEHARAESANADTAVIKTGIARFEQEGVRLDNEGKRISNDVASSDADVKKLRNDLLKIELDGLDEIIQIVKSCEKQFASGGRRDYYWVQTDSKSSPFKVPWDTYKRYKSYLDEHYYKNRSDKTNISVGAGPVKVSTSL